MAWNDVVTNMREKLRRGLGRGGAREVRVALDGARLEPLGDAPVATPAVDVYENDKELLIRADVPGGTHEGATVAWDEGRGLTFLVKVLPQPAGAVWASEYEPRDWYRVLRLPRYVDGSKAACTIKDGVLSIRIPKRAAASMLIPVRAG